MKLLATFAVLLVVAAGLAIWSVNSGPDQKTLSQPSPLPASMAVSTMNYDTPMILPGMMQPNLQSADEVDLTDDSPVIGVVVEQEPRAYLLKGMAGLGSHVINDLISEIPVTVTYCSKSDCARVLTSESRGKPIDLWVGGWMRQQFAVCFNERMYVQTSKDLPLDDLPFERTTWGDWRARHPETLIFTGGVGASEDSK